MTDRTVDTNSDSFDVTLNVEYGKGGPNVPPLDSTNATFDAAEAVIAIRKYILAQRESAASGLRRRGHLILSDIAEMVNLDAE